MALKLKGISSEIDGCSGLILSRAHAAYRRVSDEHRGWIDPDDLIQDGLVEALSAAKTYDPSFQTKFSTYLFRGLQFQFDRRYHGPLKRQMRRAKGGMVALDAPIGDDLVREIPTYDAVPADTQEAVAAFTLLVLEVSPPAAILLIGGLLCGKWTNTGKRPDAEASLLEEIRATAFSHKVSFDELALIPEDEQVAKMALKSVAGFVSIGLDREVEDARLLECVRCSGRMLLSDIKAGRYDVDTMTCRTCLRDLAAAPEYRSCFGKVTAFDPVSLDCSSRCQDRTACEQYIKKQEMTMKTTIATAPVDPLDDLDLSDLGGDNESEEQAPEAVASPAPTKKKKKASAAAPVAKVTKPVAKAPKEVTPKPVKSKAVSDAPADVVAWPFKNGSMMQAVFKLAYQGIKATKLETTVQERGNKPAIAMAVLRGGVAGCGAINGTAPPSHSWKLSEEGGVLKITNVKYLVGKAPKATAAAAKKQ